MTRTFRTFPRRTTLAWTLSAGLTLAVPGFFLPGVAQAAPPAAAPAPVDKATAANAESLFQAGEWDKAIAANEAVVQAEPGNGRAWFRLGLARIQLKRYDAAAEAFDHAEAAGYASPYLQFGRAAIAAHRHQADQAFAALDKAVAGGFANAQLLGRDEGLQALAGDPRYKALVQRIEHPCEADPGYHQLDFWLGSWEAFAGGKKDGTDVVEKTLNGCAVIENWTEARDGHQGRSLFYYLPATGQHKQVWITDQGPLKEKLSVEAPQGSVRYQGEIPQKDGSKILDRTTLTPMPGDRVHQVIEQSRNGGHDWAVVYDAIYMHPAGKP